MDPVRDFATFLDDELVPYLESIEAFLIGAGLSAADFKLYTDMRILFGKASFVIRESDALREQTAEDALMQIDTLQDGLEIILRNMPPVFTVRWNLISEHLEVAMRKMADSEPDS
jgi:hypothetical protein